MSCLSDCIINDTVVTYPTSAPARPQAQDDAFNKTQLDRVGESDPDVPFMRLDKSFGGSKTILRTAIDSEPRKKTREMDMRVGGMHSGGRGRGRREVGMQHCLDDTPVHGAAQSLRRRRRISDPSDKNEHNASGEAHSRQEISECLEDGRRRMGITLSCVAFQRVCPTQRGSQTRTRRSNGGKHNRERARERGRRRCVSAVLMFIQASVRHPPLGPFILKADRHRP